VTGGCHEQEPERDACDGTRDRRDGARKSSSVRKRAADGAPTANSTLSVTPSWRHATGRLRSTRVARLAQQFHLEGQHRRWVGHYLDLGDRVTDDAEGEHRPEAPAGSPNRSGRTVDERHLCGRGAPR
jgi:hypothetical protein